MFPALLSFESEAQAAGAAGTSSGKFILDYVGLALCLGVSTKLISQIAHNTERHYRHFALPKKGGGERPIESPRVFLRVVQWFLADFIFNEDLTFDNSVHSFVLGRSIVTNAVLHVRRAFVGSADIKNFFGSITKAMVSKCLSQNGFEPVECDLLATLCTNEDHLPQGAPSSPLLSNAILHQFDRQIARICGERLLQYSRYADDLTISGDHRSEVESAIGHSEVLLKNLYDLELHEHKTRVASRGGQQRVAGVVVNRDAAPPRTFRRRVRAIFHHASLQPLGYVERINELQGYVAFLKSFPKLKETKEIGGYEEILHGLQSLKRDTPRTSSPTAAR